MATENDNHTEETLKTIKTRLRLITPIGKDYNRFLNDVLYGLWCVATSEEKEMLRRKATYTNGQQYSIEEVTGPDCPALQYMLKSEESVKALGVSPKWIADLVYADLCKKYSRENADEFFYISGALSPKEVERLHERYSS